MELIFNSFFLHANHAHPPTVSIPFVAAILTSILHVITGPDHLAAVTPLVIESKRKAWKIGLSWGFGHLSGMLLIGFLFLVFKDYIPLDTVSKYSEHLVAYVLIGVGIWAFVKIFQESRKHNHPHVHSEKEAFIHSHEHDHDLEHSHQDNVKQNVFSSFGIGLLHGFAGIAHFILLLPVLGFENKWSGVEYILGFALGTVIAMTAYAFVLGKLTNYIKNEHNETLHQGIRLAGGLFAIIIGLYWLYLAF